MRMLTKVMVITTALMSHCAVAASEPAPRAKRLNSATMKAVREFDTNRNQRIDSDELVKLNKALASAPTGPLAPLDTNGNGRVEAAEIDSLTLSSPLAGGVRQFDKDGNRKIEGAELEALRSQFETLPPRLRKAIDSNGDSKLDDGEIAKINKRLARNSANAKRRSTAATVPPPPPKPADEPIGNGIASLRWRPPSKNSDGTALTDLAGYVIRYGRKPGALDHKVEIKDPKLTAYEIEHLGPGTWYFSIATVTTKGIESAPGGLVSKTL